jgi:ABC-2 type transport system ATP-binding protein
MSAAPAGRRGDRLSDPAVAAVEIERVSKRYGRTLALGEVSFDVKSGEFFALLGPNGAGKTTLVHILCTILRPDGGAARIAGHDVVREPLRARSRLGVVFQEPSLDDRLTVYENLNFHGLVYGVPTRLRHQRIGEMLQLVELTEWRDRLVRSLSSGMKRRLEIARTLVHDAAILFLDEPTVGLDAQSRERIWTYLATIQRERKLTIVVTTHYIEEVEACDRVCIIDRGKVLALDTPAGLKAAHGTSLLRVTPRDDATRAAIRAEYSDATEATGGVIVLKVPDDSFVDHFLAGYGARIRQMALAEQSLETVFLSLTGRELRDQAAGARERTYAFGKRGGEHTR